MENNGITGIILCGGKSSRMGQNKALLKLGKLTIIEHVIKSLEPLCNTIILNANDDKLAKFAFRKVKDLFYDIGPISGIYSSLFESETEKNLIVNCDMPFISTELLKFILDNSKGFDIVLPENKGQVQSLTGYFKKSIVPHILKEIELNHYKPVKMFKEMNLNIVQIKESQHFYRPYLFMNINSIEEYNEAIGIFDKIST